MDMRVYEKGQVTLPKVLRDQVGIQVGDELVGEVRDGEIVLRRAPSVFEHRPPRPRTPTVPWDQVRVIARAERLGE